MALPLRLRGKKKNKTFFSSQQPTFRFPVFPIFCYILFNSPFTNGLRHGLIRAPFCIIHPPASLLNTSLPDKQSAGTAVEELAFALLPATEWFERCKYSRQKDDRAAISLAILKKFVVVSRLFVRKRRRRLFFAFQAAFGFCVMSRHLGDEKLTRSISEGLRTLADASD